MGIHIELAEFVENILNKALATETNVAILALPGTGLSHYLKEYKLKKIEVTYISDIKNFVLSKLNIIDVSFLTNPDVYVEIDKLWLEAKTDQKFVVVIDDPGWVRSVDCQKSQFMQRVYKTIYLSVHQKKDVENIAKEKNININIEQINHVVSESAGLGKLIKYIAFKEDFGGSWWKNDEQLFRMITPTLVAISHCSEEELEKFGIKAVEKFVSPLIADLMTKITGATFDIKIDDDLTILENGQSFGKKMGVTEKQIINEMLKNKGIIVKEKIAEIKWGENSYDSYSDQAIKKTMMRLSVKLKKYRIKSITKVGYQIVNR